MTISLATALLSLACQAPPAERPTTPGERGHVLKMTREMVKLGTTKDASAKTDLFLRLAEERVKELHAMEAAGRTTHHAALGRSYNQFVTRGAAGSIESGAAGGKDMKAAMERYAESVNRHQEIWNRLLNRAPEEQRGSFQRALEASRRGQEDAARAHQQGLKLLMERRLMREKGRPMPPKPPPKPDQKKSMLPEERWSPREADGRRRGPPRPAGADVAPAARRFWF